MKRTPLQRTVGLARGPIPLARTIQRPRTPRPAPSDARGATKTGDWTPEVREALAARSGGVCEYCWAAPATDAHHRLRRRSGDHRIVNAAHLCRPCHRDRVHGEPKLARDLGFIVPTWGDPATQPMLLGGSRWALLRPDGTYRTDQRTGWVS